MARQADHPHVVYEVFTAELSAHAALAADLQHLFFPFQVAERAPPFVARSGQVVQVTGRRFLDGRQVRFGRRTADHQREVVRRTGRRTEVHNVRPNEFGQRLLVQQRLGLLVQERLIRRSASLGDEQEAVFVALRRVQVDLRRQVRPRIFLFGHRERHHLRIAQVAVAIRFVNAFRQGFGIVRARIYVLAFLPDHDRRAGILAGRQFALGRHRLIQQHRISDEFIVIGGLRIVQDIGQFLQVRSPEVERYVGERLARKQFQSFRVDLQDFAAVAFDRLDIIFGEQAILGGILRNRKRLLINKF